MKAFSCGVCSAVLFFGSSQCLSCGTLLGYSRDRGDIVPVNDHGVHVDPDDKAWHLCRNMHLSGCTWLSDSDDGYCFSCRLTRSRPDDIDVSGLDQYLIAEQAKRRLITELDDIGFAIRTREENPTTGLAFDLLPSATDKVITGHQNGVITLDLAESNHLYRERLRIDLDEPYRTMLGHFRHEIGHYYWMELVDSGNAEGFREMFGDERLDYSDALDAHYRDGAPDGWETSYISKYATMHPWEDFAETFAHYLHIRAAMHTATEFGMWPPLGPVSVESFRELVVKVWIPMSNGLNQINRSMGKDGLYPFVLSPPVLDKLQFVADLVPQASETLTS